MQPKEGMGTELLTVFMTKKLHLKLINLLFIVFTDDRFQLYNERKNGVILTCKVESLVELKFDPEFRVIGEYLSQIDSILRVKLTITLSISSQYDSNIFLLFGIPGKILVPPVTQLFRSK